MNLKNIPQIYYNGTVREPWQEIIDKCYLEKISIDWSAEKIRGTVIKKNGKRVVAWFTFDDLDVGLECDGVWHGTFD